jgi:hypothetical protein
MIETDLKEITYAEFAKLRYKQWQKQNEICPILKRRIKYEDAVFDHRHKRKDEEIGVDGKGLLRGVIHKNANVMEGKIARIHRRYGLHKFDIPLPDLLRSIADYIERCPMCFNNIRYIHPNERPKTKLLGKRQYNKICKHYFEMYPRSKKIPEFPKSGKLTKEFEKLLAAVNEFENKFKK